jgi:hypothetical protein
MEKLIVAVVPALAVNSGVIRVTTLVSQSVQASPFKPVRARCRIADQS